MHVLITTRHRHACLEPILAGRGLAELPVVGRSLLERTLEAVTPLAPARTSVVAGEDADRLDLLVGDGRRWGLPATVVRVGANDDGLLDASSGDRFVVPCDRLHDGDLGAALAALIARSDEGRSAVRCEASGLGWFPAGATAAATAAVKTVRLPDLDVLPVDSPAAYHAAAHAVSRGEHARLPVGGRRRAVGLRHGYLTRVHPRSVLSGHAWVGRGCRVHPTARLSGTVVIGDGSSIGRMSSVHDAVVLDDTVVGDHLDIRDAVVGGDTIVRVDTGAVLQVSDRFLLSSRGASLSEEYLYAPARQLLARVSSRPVQSAGPAGPVRSDAPPASDL